MRHGRRSAGRDRTRPRDHAAWTAAAVAALLLVLPATTGALVPDPGPAALPADDGDDPDHEETGLTGETTTLVLDALGRAGQGRKVHQIVYPLATVPAIVEDGSTLTVELDPDRVGGFVSSASASLVPSFGAADRPVELGSTSGIEPGPSDVWPDRTVLKATFDVPPLDPAAGYVEDLYDLRVTWDHPPESGELTSLGTSDVQPRAVQVVDAFPDRPRFVVVADPQVGDPRALQDGAEDSYDEQDPEPFVEAVRHTYGDGVHRWQAFRRTIEEVNLLDPDFVLFAGDVTFGQDVPGKYHVEYEDAYALVNAFRAPTFLAMGNHDGYVQSGQDGHAFWRAYFGPLRYSVDLGPADDPERPPLHIVSVNTYDWSEMDRMGVAYGVSAWGGQVRDQQLAWLDADLAAHRAAHPDGTVLTFAHHDPSWVQDDTPPPYDETEGVPLIEQIARGYSTFTTTGQGWSGDHRLDVRDLLARHDVDVHFAGHIHQDRVARYHDGHVAETTQTSGRAGQASFGEGYDPSRLHYVLRDDTLSDAFTQDELSGIVEEAGHGPLFVDTTTAASDTSLYWGWRLVELLPADADGDGTADDLDLEAFGYPASQSFLDAHAREDFWNASHADLGLFSFPSFRLNVTVDGANDGTEDHVRVELDSGLAAGLDLVVPLSLVAGPVTVTVDGAPVDDADLVRRVHGGAQDLWVPVHLGAGAGAVVEAQVA